jgi:16S rRNA (cytosine967-C5)-methyltransferase
MMAAPETKKLSAARAVAITVLVRVGEEGAYASRTLDAELSRAKLSSADAGLATEIVYGALRVLPELDARIAAQLSRDSSRMDAFTRAALRSAAYQLHHLSRVPAHAVVDETVTLVRAKRGQGLSGFVNAVLRKLAAQRPEAPEPPRALVLPTWVSKELVASLGAERAAAFVAERALPPPLGLRCISARITREELRDRIVAAHPNAEVELSTLAPSALCVRRVGGTRALPGYAEGAITVQEEGAQLVALALGARPGERIADVCAGHGGKTTLLIEQVGEQGHVTAIDVDERKLERIAPELSRLGLPTNGLETHAIDLSIGLGGLPASFDRVLVDAPCTGLGTLHRRPELLLRLQASDPVRMAELQLAILTRASKLVRPGGLLAYAVCSPTYAEGLGVVKRFEAATPHARRLFAAISDIKLTPDADGVLRIGPWLAPTSSSNGLCAPDGYQVVLFRMDAPTIEQDRS